jgi:Flp pilus assembly protein TadG
MTHKKKLHSINTRKNRGEKGNFFIELALVTPLLSLLMVAAIDSGIYMHAFISVQNAARAAAIRNSGGRESATDQQAACSIAKENLRGLPGLSSSSTCSAAPLVVTSVICEAYSACGPYPASADSEPASLVTVRFTPSSLFRLAISGPVSITRTAQMKLRNRE